MDKQIFRAYYDKYTRPARSSSELQFQRDLTALDENLHLRWSYRTNSWCVYYDHHGLVSSIRTVPVGGSFRETYLSIAQNGKTTKRDLIFQHKASIDKNEKLAQQIVEDAKIQSRHEIGNMERGRVISTVTDSKKSHIA